MVYLSDKHLYPYNLAFSKLITLYTMCIHMFSCASITVRLSQHLSALKWENAEDLYQRSDQWEYSQTETEIQEYVY